MVSNYLVFSSMDISGDKKLKTWDRVESELIFRDFSKVQKLCTMLCLLPSAPMPENKVCMRNVGGGRGRRYSWEYIYQQ